jgi:excinuclease UvrABC nuclease subunit
MCRRKDVELHVMKAEYFGLTPMQDPAAGVEVIPGSSGSGRARPCRRTVLYYRFKLCHPHSRGLKPREYGELMAISGCSGFEYEPARQASMECHRVQERRFEQAAALRDHINALAAIGHENAFSTPTNWRT